MTREQADKLWWYVVASECVGAIQDGPVERDLNSHFLAALGMVFAGATNYPLNYRASGQSSPMHRVKVAAFLHEWADAIGVNDE